MEKSYFNNNEIPKIDSAFNMPIESLPEETPEEYVSRFMKLIVDTHTRNEDIFGEPVKLLEKREYYGRYTHPSVNNFFKSEGRAQQLKEILIKLNVHNEEKFSDSKKTEMFSRLKNRVQRSSRSSSQGDVHESIDYYANTNQERSFFVPGRKRDAYSYVSMMFGLPESFVNTTEGREYIHRLIDGKTIFLFGGGDSVVDLLKDERLRPKKVINFDPFLKEESFDKNPNDIYESMTISATDEKVRQMVNNTSLPKADEVWATYSVPFYVDSSDEIRSLIKNMATVLEDGGNARISPITVQEDVRGDETFESRKQALLTSIDELINSPDYNVSMFNDTLIIHKIKKAIRE